MTGAHAHLADDEHVLTPDDALAHLGTEGTSHLHLVAVAVGSVEVPVTGGNGRFHSTLKHLGAAGLLSEPRWENQQPKIANVIIIAGQHTAKGIMGKTRNDKNDHN